MAQVTCTFFDPHNIHDRSTKELSSPNDLCESSIVDKKVGISIATTSGFDPQNDNEMAVSPSQSGYASFQFGPKRFLELSETVTDETHRRTMFAGVSTHKVSRNLSTSTSTITKSQHISSGTATTSNKSFNTEMNLKRFDNSPTMLNTKLVRHCSSSGKYFTNKDDKNRKNRDRKQKSNTGNMTDDNCKIIRRSRISKNSSPRNSKNVISNFGDKNDRVSSTNHFDDISMITVNSNYGLSNDTCSHKNTQSKQNNNNNNINNNNSNNNCQHNNINSTDKQKSRSNDNSYRSINNSSSNNNGNSSNNCDNTTNGNICDSDNIHNNTDPPFCYQFLSNPYTSSNDCILLEHLSWIKSNIKIEDETTYSSVQTTPISHTSFSDGGNQGDQSIDSSSCSDNVTDVTETEEWNVGNSNKLSTQQLHQLKEVIAKEGNGWIIDADEHNVYIADQGAVKVVSLDSVGGKRDKVASSTTTNSQNAISNKTSSKCRLDTDPILSKDGTSVDFVKTISQKKKKVDSPQTNKGDLCAANDQISRKEMDGSVTREYTNCENVLICDRVIRPQHCIIGDNRSLALKQVTPEGEKSPNDDTTTDFSHVRLTDTTGKKTQPPHSRHEDGSSNDISFDEDQSFVSEDTLLNFTCQRRVEDEQRKERAASLKTNLMIATAERKDASSRSYDHDKISIHSQKMKLQAKKQGQPLSKRKRNHLHPEKIPAKSVIIKDKKKKFVTEDEFRKAIEEGQQKEKENKSVDDASASEISRSFPIGIKKFMHEEKDFDRGIKPKYSDLNPMVIVNPLSDDTLLKLAGKTKRELEESLKRRSSGRVQGVKLEWNPTIGNINPVIPSPADRSKRYLGGVYDERFDDKSEIPIIDWKPIKELSWKKKSYKR